MLVNIFIFLLNQNSLTAVDLFFSKKRYSKMDQRT